MLGAVKQFCRKHRRLLLIAGVAAAGTAVAYQIVTESLAERERQEKCVAEEKRKRVYLDRARIEWKTGLCNFLPTLKKRLCATVDVLGPVKELREVRDQQTGGSEGAGSKETKEGALWDEVKVLTFTRLLTGVYGFVALDLMLGLQLHMLGRYGYEDTERLLQRSSSVCSPCMKPYDVLLQRLSSLFSSNHHQQQQQQQYQELNGSCGAIPNNPKERMMVDLGAEQNGCSSSNTATEHPSYQPDNHLNMEEEREEGLTGEAQHLLLSSTYEHVLGDGLASISKDIRAVVEHNMESWHCESKLEVGRDELFELLINIRLEFEGPDKGRDLMTKYFIKPNGEEHRGEMFANESNTKQVQLLLNETWDAMESPGFHVALQHALTSIFITLFRDVDKVVFGLESGREGPHRDSCGGGLPCPPLASVVTNIKVILAEMLDPVMTNEYAGSISRLDAVIEMFHSAFHALTLPVSNYNTIILH